MKKEVTYIVEKDNSGKILALYRFWDDEFSHEEVFAGGEWKQNNSLVDVLFNLHNPAYEEINKEEAKLIMAQLNFQTETRLQPA